MIDLYTALKLVNAFDSEKEIVHLRKKDQIFKSEYELLTVKQIKEKYDMRKIKVIEICPYFCCGDYEGFLFTIVGQQATPSNAANTSRKP